MINTKAEVWETINDHRNVTIDEMNTYPVSYRVTEEGTMRRPKTFESLRAAQNYARQLCIAGTTVRIKAI